MQRIDAHVHIYAGHPDWAALLERLDLILFNVCVAHDASGDWREGRDVFRSLVEGNAARFAWCTAFDPPTWEDSSSAYVERVIAELEQDTTAVGCKIWKNMGMSLCRPDGSHVLPDDPVFDPIYEHLARTGRTLLAHIAEPRACWLPLDPEQSALWILFPASRVAHVPATRDAVAPAAHRRSRPRPGPSIPR